MNRIKTIIILIIIISIVSYIIYKQNTAIPEKKTITNEADSQTNSQSGSYIAPVLTIQIKKAFTVSTRNAQRISAEITVENQSTGFMEIFVNNTLIETVPMPFLNTNIYFFDKEVAKIVQGEELMPPIYVIAVKVGDVTEMITVIY